MGTAWPSIDATMPGVCAEHAGVIVPAKTVGELRKLLDDDEYEIAVPLSEDKDPLCHAALHVDFEISTGTFPDHAREFRRTTT